MINLKNQNINLILYLVQTNPYLIIQIIHPEQMHEPMCERGKENGHGTQKYNPTEQGIDRCEKFGGVCFHFINGAHTCQDHGRIVNTVYPTQITNKMIPQNTNPQGKNQKSQGHYRIGYHPFCKFFWR